MRYEGLIIKCRGPFAILLGGAHYIILLWYGKIFHLRDILLHV